MIGWMWHWLAARAEFTLAKTESRFLKLADYETNFFLLAAKSAIFWSEFPAILWELHSAPRGPERTIFTSARFSTRLQSQTTDRRMGWIGLRLFAAPSTFPSSP